MNLKEKNKASHELSIEKFLRIKALFDEMNWPYKLEFDDDVFDNFCKMMSELDSDQFDLLITLSKNFLWIQNNEYMSLFSDAFDCLINNNNHINKIMICPLLPEEDFGLAKSSISLLYQIKAHINAIQCRYSSFDISYIESPKEIDSYLIESDYSFCFVDDFVGTGETAEKALQYIHNKKIVNDRIFILSLVAMKSGVSYINNLGIKVYQSKLCDKGLSIYKNDYFVKLMQRIEDRIRVKDENKFGYKGSEALVKMIRTPNNTFPIYWLKNKRNKHAPFPR